MPSMYMTHSVWPYLTTFWPGLDEMLTVLSTLQLNDTCCGTDADRVLLVVAFSATYQHLNAFFVNCCKGNA